RQSSGACATTPATSPPTARSGNAPAGPATGRCSYPPPRSCSTWQASRQNGCARSEEHTSELQSLAYLVCRLLLEKKKNINITLKHTEVVNSDNYSIDSHATIRYAYIASIRSTQRPCARVATSRAGIITLAIILTY